MGNTRSRRIEDLDHNWNALVCMNCGLSKQFFLVHPSRCLLVFGKLPGLCNLYQEDFGQNPFANATNGKQCDDCAHMIDDHWKKY